jgi:DNA-binding response OmpR family regulator
MRILLVDDDPEFVRLVETVLRREGLTVISCLDGLEALDTLAKESFDLVVTDYEMPHLSGESLIERIRSSARHEKLPIVVVSAHTEEELTDVLMRKGAAFYLPKPLDFRQLVSIVRFAAG